MTLLRRLFLVLLLAATAHQSQAQELLCKVQVQHAKILNVDPAVFTGMERAITEFLNSRKWTPDIWSESERIPCNVMLNLTNKTPNDDIYTATITIQATRPVYNASYTSSLINYIDRDVSFRYTQFNPLQFDDNRVSGPDALASNLTAVLAYYAYLTLGLDYESFSPSGGDAMFKKAQSVVANAPEEGNIKGWKAFEDKRNRYWIIDNILSPRFTPFRTMWYDMHRKGLDMLYTNPVEARQKLLTAVGTMNTLQKENPAAGLIPFFFAAKSDELMRVVAQLPREERLPYVTALSSSDVANAQKYNGLR